MRQSYQILTTIVIVGVAVVIGWFARPPKALAPTNATTNVNRSTNTTTNTNTATQAFSTSDLPDRDPRFAFQLSLPDGLAADYSSASKAIRFYLPTESGDSAVHIVVLIKGSLPQTTRTTTTIDGMSARWFELQKETAGAGLPTWVTEPHREAWVAIKGDAKEYYVFAQSPKLDNTTFTQVVASLQFSPDLLVKTTLSD